ncbi:MOSC domain-containing protein [Chroococcidiopsis sp. CCMEE 29]|uniref:MOSC domain-containing protein n=1 Tax=Chroococcidiopsis sp. CCMEE 29 TaxID=155894 RepID=UPI0031F8B1A6
MTAVSVKQLFIHPVKGLTPQAKNCVDLKAGHGIPGDRAFALMYESQAIDHASSIVPWMKKQNFAMQCDWPALAALDCRYDPQTAVLTVKRQGVELLAAETNTPTGRDRIGAFFTGYLAAIYPSQAARHPDRAPLRLVGDCTGTTRYPDREPVHLSLVSQATLDQLSVTTGKIIDVRRFRPNVLLEGVPAWAELAWVGQEIYLGTARLQITAPINRCLNIDVNPETGERDIQLFSLLQQHFKHKQTGVLAKVITDGKVTVDDGLIPHVSHQPPTS